MCFFSLGVVGGLAADRLDALLPPALLAGVGDVHELGADGAAVRLAQRLQDLAQRHVLVGREVRVRRRERDVHVGFGQVVERRIELGDARTLGALERIEVGPARAEEAVGGDQRLDVDLLARDGEVGRAGLDGEGVGLGALREGLDHRRVRDVAGVGAVGGGHVLQRVEVGAPRIRHGAGVLEIGLVHLFHVRRVAAEQVGVGPVLFHHLSLTFRPGFRSYDGLINLPRPGSTGWRIANALLPDGGQQGDTEGLLATLQTMNVALTLSRCRGAVCHGNMDFLRGTRPCHALAQSLRPCPARSSDSTPPPRRNRPKPHPATAAASAARPSRARSACSSAAAARAPARRCRGIPTRACTAAAWSAPRASLLPWLPAALAPLLSRLARRWISAASGCDSNLVVEAPQTLHPASHRPAAGAGSVRGGRSTGHDAWAAVSCHPPSRMRPIEGLTTA